MCPLSEPCVRHRSALIRSGVEQLMSRECGAAHACQRAERPSSEQKIQETEETSKRRRRRSSEQERSLAHEWSRRRVSSENPELKLRHEHDMPYAECVPPNLLPYRIIFDVHLIPGLDAATGPRPGGRLIYTRWFEDVRDIRDDASAEVRVQKHAVRNGGFARNEDSGMAVEVAYQV